MVGLSVVLESHKSGNSNTSSSGVINKATMKAAAASSSSSHHHQPPAFLEHCFLCKQKLLPGKDIYMYKGDRAFCSVDCRCRQILLDEELEILKNEEKCSASASRQHRRKRTAGGSGDGGGNGGCRFAY